MCGERGNKPTGITAVEEAANTLYNASYGIDTLTGAPLNYKQNAGHLLDFKNHGQGQTRPEQDRVNKAFQEADGMRKLLLAEQKLEEIKAAELYSKNIQLRWNSCCLSYLAVIVKVKGWQPELNAMRKSAKRYHLM